jgi:CHASE2 domain-containing sensor protein
LTALLGLVLWQVSDERVVGVNFKGLAHLSHDTLFRLRPATATTNVVIVAMDEESYRRLGQSQERRWDRSLHANLIDSLLTHGARTIVFDIVFADPWPDPQVDARMVETLKRAGYGRVILAGSMRRFEVGEVGGSQVELPPIEPFAAVAQWGIVDLPQDSDGVLRRHPDLPQSQQTTHLAWRIAEGSNPSLDHDRFRWINYYGPSQSIRHVSYYQALQFEGLPPDVFSNRVVFVGRSRIITPRGADPGDEYPTPYGQRLSGVEIQATVFLNLLRGDWIEEMPWPVEAMVFILCGALAGYGLAFARPLPALGWAVVGALLVGAGALLLFATQRLWFNWLVVAGVQIPFALGWSVLSFVQRASQARDIPDHTLLRCVGRGAYGEVWLARDVIGGFHAVKIIYRKKFPTAEPFEREFRGITNSAALSRSHPGLVHILHVGRNDLRGCFYYVMEAADDESSGAKIHPDRYVPRTLAGEIARRGRLPVGECVQLALDLTAALEHLHGQQLVHRDVKPANVVFVNGRPKLADVGLVTTLERGEMTQIGTSGYLPPEGPGSAAADVFALGKTLYEAATGNACGQFPELPSGLNAGQEADDLLQFHEILLTACETDPIDRYGSAAAMRADLLALQSKLAKTSSSTA